MEIISEVGISAGVIILGALAILFGIVIIGVCCFILEEKDFFTTFVGVVTIFLGIVLMLSEAHDEKKYRLRIDDTTTVSELKETYKIVRYDPDTDLWIVRKKEVKE